MDRENRELLEKQLEFINLLLKFRQTSKLLKGFLIPFNSFVESDGRIRSSFHNTVCVTGRLSSSKPNIEQLPKNNSVANIRNLFVADTGNVLIVADYSGQEVRIMAEESGDKKFKQALRDGLDLHQVTADNMGVKRNDAKCVVFGTAYGKTAHGFAKDFHCSLEEAQQFIDKFLDTYPMLRVAIAKTREQVYKYGYVKNMSGRKRRFPNFHKLNKWAKERCYRQAFNHKIQSAGADMVKVAVSKIITNPLIKLVNIVHDEIVCEVNKNYTDEAIAFITHCMITTIPLSIPLEIDIQAGERYGDCK